MLWYSSFTYRGVTKDHLDIYTTVLWYSSFTYRGVTKDHLDINTDKTELSTFSSREVLIINTSNVKIYILALNTLN